MGFVFVGQSESGGVPQWSAEYGKSCSRSCGINGDVKHMMSLPSVESWSPTKQILVHLLWFSLIHCPSGRSCLSLAVDPERQSAGFCPHKPQHAVLMNSVYCSDYFECDPLLHQNVSISMAALICWMASRKVWSEMCRDAKRSNAQIFWLCRVT